MLDARSHRGNDNHRRVFDESSSNSRVEAPSSLFTACDSIMLTEQRMVQYADRLNKLN